MQQIVSQRINPLVTVKDEMTFVLHTWAKSLHVRLTIATLEMETCVRGFHAYKAIMEAAVMSEKNRSVGEREATE